LNDSKIYRLAAEGVWQALKGRGEMERGITTPFAEPLVVPPIDLRAVDVDR
jgi:hypothetical protein